VAQEIPFQLGYFLAGDTLDYRLIMDPELPDGEYDATLSLTYLDQSVEQTTRLSIGGAEELPEVRENASVEQATQSSDLPLWAIVAGVVVVVVLLMLILFVMMLTWRQSRVQPQR